MNKSTFLAVVFGVLAFFGLAFGAYTTFTDLRTTGDILVGDDLTVTDELTVTGDTTLGGAVTGDSLTISGIVDVTVTTPTVAGMLVVDSNYVLYIATATTSIADWIKVGTQS